MSAGMTSNYWTDKRVLVTGGSGFLGTYVVDELRRRGCGSVFDPRSAEYDLRRQAQVQRMYEALRPDIVIHLAATVGGIGANRTNPGRFFYDNAIMGIETIEQARVFGVEKFVCVGTICAYPKFTPVPFREDELWNGYPEETNAPYGLAKRMLLVQCQSYRQQYGLNAIYLLPVNLYGPNDNFDLTTSHVVPALIRKCVEARARGEKKIIAWGTGNVSREFLYVTDAADGILLAAEHYNKPEPVNLGTGEQIQIRDLVAIIAELTGFRGAIEWDATQPDGQPLRCLDVSRALKEFGFQAKHRLREGLAKTVEWYEKKAVTAAVAH
jgi:GDP-L-fucose synthase